MVRDLIAILGAAAGRIGRRRRLERRVDNLERWVMNHHTLIPPHQHLGSGEYHGHIGRPK